MKILGQPSLLDHPGRDSGPVDGCRIRATWAVKGGTFDVCFDRVNKVFFMALRTHEPIALGPVKLGADTLATIARFQNKVLRKSCTLDEGYLTGAVTFRGHRNLVEIILSGTTGPYAVEQRCPDSMVINRVAVWMKATAAPAFP